MVTVAEGAPATMNDQALADRMHGAASSALGKERVLDAHAVMGSEDVGLFTLEGKIPGAMYWLGAADPEKLAQSKETTCHCRARIHRYLRRYTRPRSPPV